MAYIALCHFGKEWNIKIYIELRIYIHVLTVTYLKELARCLAMKKVFNVYVILDIHIDFYHEKGFLLLGIVFYSYTILSE